MSTSTNNLLVKQLVEFGLSEKEAKVYLTLLELEIAAVSEIAKTANINRSSTYVVLESLKRKGLVSTSEDKKIQRYVAVSPEILLREAEDKAKKSDDVKNNISDIIPELKALYKGTKQKPKIKVFEGKQGLISSFEDTLSCKEKIMRVSSSGEHIVKVLFDYFPIYVQKRAELGIRMYGIHPDDKMGKKILKTMPSFDRSVLIPPKKYNLQADLAIYDNKISYMSTAQELAIIIESQEMADVMKSIFDLAYEEAKRLNKDIMKNKKSN